jgi:hypothetical protein
MRLGGLNFSRFFACFKADEGAEKDTTRYITAY